MKITYLCAIALLAIGCKGNLQEPTTAANVPSSGEKQATNQPTNKDLEPTFSQCAEASWNKGKEYVGKAWDASKPVIRSWADDAEKAYDDWKKTNPVEDDKKEESPSEP